MDYSVGSLADLISGSNTPNKTKVIQQEFKKQKPDFLKTDNKITKIQKPFKKISVENTTQGVRQNINKSTKKKFKKLKVEHSDKDEKGPIQLNKKQKLKKAKFDSTEVNSNTKNAKQKKSKKKKLNTSNSEADFINSGEHSSPILYQKGQKTKKRKLDPSNSETNFVNSDEHSPPKRKKLNQNEQNAERRINNKTEKEKRVENPEELTRTVFVGNIPITTDKKKIIEHFKIYGNIESVRIRGIPVADPKTSKKVAAIKKEFNPKRNTVYCFIRFENKEEALNTEVENGVLFEGHHLRIHTCGSNEKPDETKAIFVGNVSFDAEEDELWKLFEPCGPISYVRLVRDPHTGMGKGFGYINFKDSDAVQLALEMENVKLRERELRISLCNHNVARKKKFSKNKKIARPGKPKRKKKIENSSDKDTSAGSQEKVKKEDTGYQGTKFGDKKKKRKVNKGLLGKKKMIKKIAPKPKINKE